MFKTPQISRVHPHFRRDKSVSLRELKNAKLCHSTFMPEIASLLDKAEQLPLNSPDRRRLETRVLEETAITNFNQVATLVEGLALSAALENGASGDEDTAEALFAQAQTIADALRRLHDLIQELA